MSHRDGMIFIERPEKSFFVPASSINYISQEKDGDGDLCTVTIWLKNGSELVLRTQGSIVGPDLAQSFDDIVRQ